MARFLDRLKALGFASYNDYLASDHWQAFRRRYRDAPLSRQCAVCAGGPVQLHHHTYDRLGCESLSDVTPLCREHHEAVHAWLKEHGKPVGATHKAVRRLRDGLPAARSARSKKGKARPPREVRPLAGPRPDVVAAAEAVLASLMARYGQVRKGRGRCYYKRLLAAAGCGNMAAVNDVAAKLAVKPEADQTADLFATYRALTDGGVRHPCVPTDYAMDPNEPDACRVAVRRYVKLLRRSQKKAARPPTPTTAQKRRAAQMDAARHAARLTRDRAANPVKYILRDAMRGRYGH